jgi:hypothetical protein
MSLVQTPYFITRKPALKTFCSGSSRDAPAWDLALKIRCTLEEPLYA